VLGLWGNRSPNRAAYVQCVLRYSSSTAVFCFRSAHAECRSGMRRHKVNRFSINAGASKLSDILSGIVFKQCRSKKTDHFNGLQVEVGKPECPARSEIRYPVSPCPQLVVDVVRNAGILRTSKRFRKASSVYSLPFTGSLSIALPA